MKGPGSERQSLKEGLAPAEKLAIALGLQRRRRPAAAAGPHKWRRSLLKSRITFLRATTRTPSVTEAPSINGTLAQAQLWLLMLVLLESVTVPPTP